MWLFVAMSPMTNSIFCSQPDARYPYETAMTNFLWTIFDRAKYEKTNRRQEERET